jgi:NADH-quinone oxidoreductase subunit E
MVQINADYFEDLDADNFAYLLGELRAGRPVRPGSQTGRSASAPAGGPTTLSDPALYDGSMVGAWRQRFEPKEDAAGTPEARGRPDPEPRGEQQAAHHPAQRATEGKPPIKPADEGEAAPAPDTPSLRGDPAAAKAGRAARGSGLLATTKPTRAKAPEKKGVAGPAEDTPPEQEDKK